MHKRKAEAAPPADELSSDLDFLIRDTRVRLYTFIETQLADRGIPLRFWYPLRALYRNEGITQRELGQLLGYQDARAGVIIAAMRRKRLVSRQPSRIDKRKIELYLTPAGKHLAQTTLRSLRAVEARMLQGFSTAEALTFRSLLGRVHENLESAD